LAGDLREGDARRRFVQSFVASTGASANLLHCMESPHSPIKDPKRIDLDDRAELESWCTLLKLAPEDLRTAVQAVGPMSAAVAVYVNSRGRRGVFRQVGEIGHPFERRETPRPADEARAPKPPSKLSGE
jgi:Protein of unknown function (DUF3606)